MKQPTTQSVYDLFNSRIQFMVPVYQRAYVWNEEQNWAVMWDDIADTADRYIADPDAHVRQQHFLGPIVLDQQHFDAGGVDPRLVIDGQQRLTTLQIILSAAASVAREKGAEDVAKELAQLTTNQGRAADGDLRYKVWPSRRDRAAFLDTIANGEDASATGGIPGAWRYFRDRIRDWVSDDGDADSEQQTARIQALQVCLDSLLYVVSINLDESDNAQVIFESLNARGTGLGALDLVKNATFLQAEREKAPAEALHDGHWEPTFEADDYWMEEIRQGRLKRARADLFLMHWLVMELGVVVRADKLFDTFRKDILHAPDASPMTELVPRLCEDARIMRSFDDFELGTREQLFFARMEAMDTTTMLPVALLLFRSVELEPERRERALAALESWLVRRAALRLTAKNYNRTLTSLLKAIKKDLAHADEAVVRELRSSEAATSLWPSDDEVRRRLEHGALYDYVSRPRVRMLLEACELDVRDAAKTEAIALPVGLSIEHALPQSWEEHWPLPEGDPETLQTDREAHVNRLGNLTLVTQPLNSAMSNAAWLKTSTSAHSKRDELASRTILLINQRLVQHDHWDEQLIDERGRELTESVLRTWPGPTADVWPETSTDSDGEPHPMSGEAVPADDPRAGAEIAEADGENTTQEARADRDNRLRERVVAMREATPAVKWAEIASELEIDEPKALFLYTQAKVTPEQRIAPEDLTPQEVARLRDQDGLAWHVITARAGLAAVAPIKRLYEEATGELPTGRATPDVSDETATD